MKLIELAKKRRSIRRYKLEHVDDEILREILKTALLAPSSWGRHPVEFYVVRDKQLQRQIANCKRIGASPVSAADVAIIVAVDLKDCELWIEDASVASTYILLAAEEHDIGACWIQIRNRDGQKKSASEEIKDLLNIPLRFEVVNIVALGLKDEVKKSRTDSDLAIENVHGFEI